MKTNKLSLKESRALAVAAKIVREKARGKGNRTLVSGLEGLVTDLGAFAPTINQTETLEFNLRYAPLTFERQTLSYLYMENGLIRTAIDQPVDDALRGGVDIESPELDVDDIKALTNYLEENGVWEQVKTTMKWGRLFGGAGLIVNNGQDPSTRLDLKSMDENSPLAFEDADRWELSMPNKNQEKQLQELMYPSGDLFFYYAKPIHRTRVISVVGDRAPSLINRLFMGWGVSEVEKMVRDINQYIKAQDVIFELLDEAKMDVYRLEGYKSSLIRPGGQEKMARAVGLTNSLKSYLNALILDKNDEYDQKQLTFSGLAEMLKEIRIGIAATLRMPVEKLFGESAAGFSSGEDSIENYNAMIESDIRSRLRPLISTVIDVASVKLFGYQPDTSFKYKSLRIMKQNEEQDLKGKKQGVVLANYDRQLMTAKECMDAQRSEGLLTIEKTAAEQGLTEDYPNKQGTDTQEETPPEAEKSGKEAREPKEAKEPRNK
jgi:phage-related protein (TIGR01555 family)